MEEVRDPKSAVNGSSGEQQGGETSHPSHDAEATSSETLSDVEKGEKTTTGGASTDTGSALEGASPEPVTEGGGRADGSDTGGPM